MAQESEEAIVGENPVAYEDQLVADIEKAVRSAGDCDDDCSCVEVADHIFEIFDLNMPTEQAERLHAHVRTCPNCSRLAQAESHVREMIKRSCSESAPASLRARITAQLEVYRSATQ